MNGTCTLLTWPFPKKIKRPDFKVVSVNVLSSPVSGRLIWAEFRPSRKLIIFVRWRVSSSTLRVWLLKITKTPELRNNCKIELIRFASFSSRSYWSFSWTCSCEESFVIFTLGRGVMYWFNSSQIKSMGLGMGFKSGYLFFSFNQWEIMTPLSARYFRYSSISRL